MCVIQRVVCGDNTMRLIHVCGCGALIVVLSCLMGCATNLEFATNSVKSRVVYSDSLQVNQPVCYGNKDTDCGVVLSAGIEDINPQLLVKVLQKIDAFIVRERPSYVVAMRREHVPLLGPAEGGEMLYIHLEKISECRTFVTIVTQRKNVYMQDLWRRWGWSSHVAQRLASEVRLRMESK